jgi:hypothetical protein
MNEDKFKNDPPPRDFQDVISRVILQVPHEDRQLALRGCLRKLRNDAAYTAPEDMQRRWAELGMLLNTNLPWPPKEDWQTRISSIVRGLE